MLIVLFTNNQNDNFNNNIIQYKLLRHFKSFKFSTSNSYCFNFQRKISAQSKYTLMVLEIQN